ncbi:MAG: 23S rRNA (guanosine2251-2'-O)-methyltransferase [Flavobacteriales bacterium]|jgi:23S rRNA (guanosine2251-2'-O)-methyltransferase
MKKENDELVFGIRATIEAIDAGKEINKLFIQNGISNPLIGELKKTTQKWNIPIQYVPVEKLNRISQKNHQGVICFVSPISYQPLDQLIPLWFEEGKNPLVLILDRVTDVRNFGAICRTAECVGVDAVIVPTKGGAMVNADAIKTSAGALHRISVCREMYLKETIDYLKSSGFNVVGCTEKTDKTIYDANLTGPTAIIMGSEEDGISPEYMKRCNELSAIPLNGNIASLNVSVAAGVILYECQRQRIMA